MNDKPSLNSPIKSGEATERTHITIACADADFIRLLYPRNNTLAHVLNTLLRKFNSQLKAYGINDTSQRDAFFNAVSQCTISIIGHTTEVADRSPVEQPVRRPIAGASELLEGTPLHDPSVEGVPNGGTRRGRNRRTGAPSKG
jgi:hypothetical protein